MVSPTGERAIEDALDYGNAILKFISANDVDLTGAHQYAYYLPKSVWEMYTIFPPEKGRNDPWPVRVLWHDGRTTDSIVYWYGMESRSEYRISRFGRNFPFRTFDNIGDLLVLIPTNSPPNEFHAYVLDLDEDIAEIQAALGVEAVEKKWGAYRAGVPQPPETADVCLDRHFREFLKPLEAFPSTAIFSNEARRALIDCLKADFAAMTADERLIGLIDSEYRLFRMVERQLCQPEIQRVFKNVEDFLSTAHSISNRRKSRAGRSLENHVAFLLGEAGVKFDSRAKIDGKVEPDILIPGKDEYNDPNFPVNQLCVVGVKTTCKDRWRQVLSEGKRIPHKHILTLQPGISANQLKEMQEKNVSLIVPAALHNQYPMGTGIELLSVQGFIDGIRAQMA